MSAIIPSDIQVQNVLKVFESPNNGEHEIWAEALSQYLKDISKEDLVTKIIPIAEQKANVTGQIAQKIGSCHLIGAVLKVADYIIVKRNLLPLVFSLCQDASPDVRASICTQLRWVCKTIQGEFQKLGFQSLFIDLANDEHIAVRIQLFYTLLHSSPDFSTDIKNELVIPVFKNFLNSATLLHDIEMTLHVANCYGRMLSTIRNAISPKEMEWFIMQYKDLCYIGLHNEYDILSRIYAHNTRFLLDRDETCVRLNQCRRACAENFALVIQQSYSCMIESLYNLYTSLSKDPAVCVRKQIASSIGQVALCFQKFNHSILDVFLSMMNDGHDDVVFALVPSITTVLNACIKLKILKTTNTDKVGSQVMESFLMIEERVCASRNWRTIVAIIQQFAALPKYFPSNFVFESLSDRLFFRLVSLRQVPCKLEAGKTLLIFMKESENVNDVLRFRNRFIDEICCSSCFYTRTIYVQLCYEAIKLLGPGSDSYLLLTSLLSLAGDPVVNIRISLCQLMPRYVKLLKELNYKQGLVIAEKIIEKLQQDSANLVNYLDPMRQELFSLAEQHNEEMKITEICDKLSDLNISSEISPTDMEIDNAEIEQPVNGKKEKVAEEIAEPTKTEAVVSSLDLYGPKDKSQIETEKEFIIDTGISMKGTNQSRIPTARKSVSSSFPPKIILSRSGVPIVRKDDKTIQSRDEFIKNITVESLKKTFSKHGSDKEPMETKKAMRGSIRILKKGEMPSRIICETKADNIQNYNNSPTKANSDVVMDKDDNNNISINKQIENESSPRKNTQLVSVDNANDSNINLNISTKNIADCSKDNNHVKNNVDYMSFNVSCENVKNDSDSNVVSNINNVLFDDDIAKVNSDLKNYKSESGDDSDNVLNKSDDDCSRNTIIESDDLSVANKQEDFSHLKSFETTSSNTMEENVVQNPISADISLNVSTSNNVKNYYEAEVGQESICNERNENIDLTSNNGADVSQTVDSNINQNVDGGTVDSSIIKNDASTFDNTVKEEDSKLNANNVTKNNNNVRHKTGTDISTNSRVDSVTSKSKTGTNKTANSNIKNAVLTKTGENPKTDSTSDVGDCADKMNKTAKDKNKKKGKSKYTHRLRKRNSYYADGAISLPSPYYNYCDSESNTYYDNVSHLRPEYGTFRTLLANDYTYYGSLPKPAQYYPNVQLRNKDVTGIGRGRPQSCYEMRFYNHGRNDGALQQHRFSSSANLNAAALSSRLPVRYSK